MLAKAKDNGRGWVGSSVGGGVVGVVFGGFILFGLFGGLLQESGQSREDGTGVGGRGRK